VTSGDELREAMRRFPSGVAVVTINLEGRRQGTTVGSLVSLSLEPALVGVSIGHQSSLHEPLREAKRFAVNILAGDQDWLAQHFARSVPPIVQWDAIPTHATSLPEPLIADALAWLECRTWAEYPAGDHTFFVGEVLSLELGRSAPALVYVGSSYRQA
jgi:flavin reductase (DIM6/NTAB) family NADH-FMN oxidoreductase RutF